jgi:transposase
VQKTACCFIPPVINKFIAKGFLWRNRVRPHGRNQRLEPDVKKFTRPVLRGGDDGNIIPLTRPYKRGNTYGTILVDLERHQVIDLLPDRNSETVKVWLQEHPEIEVISRDRASSYADAARQGAPQATQVADRFHLTKNVREKLKDLLDRKRTCLPFVEQSPVQSAPTMLLTSQEKGSLGEAAICGQEKSTSSVTVAVLEQLDEGDSSRPLTAPEWRRNVSREKRYGLYEDVKGLREQGLSHYAIADTLGISRPTVRRFLAAEQFPERLAGPTRPRQSIVAPYLPLLRERWQAGCHNGRQLFREAKARGYAGSPAQLERVTTQWRKQLPPSPPGSPAPPRPTPVTAPKRRRLSSQQARLSLCTSQREASSCEAPATRADVSGKSGAVYGV